MLDLTTHAFIPLGFMRMKRLFLIFSAVLLLTGSGCESHDDVHSHANETSPEEAEAVTPLVVLIGGIDSDPTPEQIAGKAARGEGNCGPFQLCGDLRADGYNAEYFNWNGTRAGQIETDNPPAANGIAECIRGKCLEEPETPVFIVGNSWGGHTAWEVCELLADEPTIEVELVVFLDPSSLGRLNALRPESLPACIRSAATYFTHNAGGWGAWEGEPRITNIDLGDPANGFLVPGGPAYDSVFSITAHIAAEWDERIHQSIRERIAGAVQEHGSHAD